VRSPWRIQKQRARRRQGCKGKEDAQAEVPEAAGGGAGWQAGARRRRRRLPRGARAPGRALGSWRSSRPKNGSDFEALMREAEGQPQTPTFSGAAQGRTAAAASSSSPTPRPPPSRQQPQPGGVSDSAAPAGAAERRPLRRRRPLRCRRHRQQRRPQRLCHSVRGFRFRAPSLAQTSSPWPTPAAPAALPPHGICSPDAATTTLHGTDSPGGPGQYPPQAYGQDPVPAGAGAGYGLPAEVAQRSSGQASGVAEWDQGRHQRGQDLVHAARAAVRSPPGRRAARPRAPAGPRLRAPAARRLPRQ